MEKTIRLSIVLPSYNYARYLSSALDSVLSQEWQNYELILIDDASTDESSAISQKYAKNYPQIRFVQNEKNVGAYKCAEKALAIAKGDFVHFFSADDLYFPGFLSKSMTLLENYPQCGLVCTDIGYFNDGEALFHSKRLLEETVEPIFFGTETLPSLFQQTNFWIPGATCIVKKELLQKHNGFDPLLENIADWFLFHRIALFEGVMYLPEMLIAMRMHDQTYTRQVKSDKKRKYATYNRLLDVLASKEMRDVREKFKEAALLSFIFKERFWRLRFDPRYLDFWPKLKR